VRQNAARLVGDGGDGQQKEIRSFRVGLDQPLGLKRGRDKGCFVDGVFGAIDTFYSEILQGMRAWTAPPPRLREESSDEPVAEELISSSMSSQDGPVESSFVDLAVPSETARVSELPGPRHPSRREVRLARHLDAEGTATLAGWYQDPAGEPQLRWWNGEAWSDETYPAVTAVVSAPLTVASSVPGDLSHQTVGPPD
jgi:hypothetical protein